MGTPKTGKAASNSAARKARIEEMRRKDAARERRNRILTITASAVIVAAVGGFGAYAVNSSNDKKEQKAAAAKKPVRGEQTWNTKKLGRTHVTKPVDYPMTPAAGGNHNQVWANCEGTVYKKALTDDNAVHSLEHGAVWVTYNDKAADADVQKLGDRVEKTPYTMMSPVKEQSGRIMLTAWGHQLSVDKASDPRVEQFLGKYVQGSQTPEPGATCSTGQMG
ncbi:DUF3105 domain-containing protein [Streptomyces sp. CdTB01]|uniref:DUF3105 domain-containing protein n=1 Tax=Streptomyces sp. CdTB01 TaxID=1725411 RepID=UPI00073A947E|nr:DUF3105 domain-containing protein [Streptomyces sp. CdTB01]ALV39214.1 hypothetical protein AS200_44755 [Streptomyces sp. CdTB01]